MVLISIASVIACVCLAERKINGQERDNDRSGCGPGGDRIGKGAVVAGYQVCALDLSNDNRDSDISSLSARPLCERSHLPLGGGVRVSQDGTHDHFVPAGVVLTLFLLEKGEATTASPEDTSCHKSDSCHNSLSQKYISKRRLGPTSATRPSGDMCSKIIASSSPRRSAGVCDVICMSCSII